MDIDLETTEEIQPTTEPSKSIKPIEKDSVHRICSGQVVLSLAIAVKELVENSVDAGATVIEIKLKEYGSEAIEVIDNGPGVEECNFEALTLKHHTSKIRSFSDVMSVTTFGFRGEALSSLCALSDLMITTRHSSSTHGTKVEYDHNGKIKSKTPCARQIGTTVTLLNLFSTLPVRYKEFHRNLKREFSKMCNLLYAYCLISENVRILCTNQTKSGQKSTIVSTQAKSSTKENISCIFGSKQLQSLLEFKQIDPSEEILKEYGIKDISKMQNPFKISCFISSCEHGNGRSAADRQFYFVNSRPCEPVRVTKLVNEIYRQFNGNQYPFVFMHLNVEQRTVDVNVTPDKRKVFLEEEKLLLAIIKTSLLKLYEKIPGTFTLQNTTLESMSFIKEEKESQSSQSDYSDQISKVLGKWRNTGSGSQSSDSSNGLKRALEPEEKMTKGMKACLQKRIKVDENFSQDLSEASSDEEVETKEDMVETITQSAVDVSLSQLLTTKEESSDEKEDVVETITQNAADVSLSQLLNTKEESSDEEEKTKEDILKTNGQMTADDPLPQMLAEDVNTSLEIKDKPYRSCKMFTYANDSEEPPIHIREKLEKLEYPDGIPNTAKPKPKSPLLERKLVKVYVPRKSNNYDFAETSIIPDRRVETVDISIEEIKEDLIEQSIKYLQREKENKNTVVKFRSKIAPNANKNAEEELKKEISKDMFKKMKIVGQFNKGFIIVRLDDDLFIIDQHATDEKYNFEMLQKTTVLENQKLVVPQSLELTAANETALIENMDVFKKNGFSFEIDENAETGKKVKLTDIPISKNWQLGKDDIDELLYMLRECPQSTYRPSRISAMFASRACRKSVMVGKDLSKKDMETIVGHMAETEQPWNCPHGRPTMRHLVNLALLRLTEEISTTET